MTSLKFLYSRKTWRTSKTWFGHPKLPRRHTELHTLLRLPSLRRGTCPYENGLLHQSRNAWSLQQLLYAHLPWRTWLSPRVRCWPRNNHIRNPETSPLGYYLFDSTETKLAACCLFWSADITETYSSIVTSVVTIEEVSPMFASSVSSASSWEALRRCAGCLCPFVLSWPVVEDRGKERAVLDRKGESWGTKVAALDEQGVDWDRERADQSWEEEVRGRTEEKVWRQGFRKWTIEAAHPGTREIEVRPQGSHSGQGWKVNIENLLHLLTP